MDSPPLTDMSLRDFVAALVLIGSTLAVEEASYDQETVVAKECVRNAFLLADAFLEGRE